MKHRFVNTARVLALVALASAPLLAHSQPGPPFVRGQDSRSERDELRMLQRIMTLSRFEARASEMALERTRNRHVRTLAKRLARNAGIMQAALRSLAAQGVRMPPRPDLSFSHRQSLEQMRELPEPYFDARYLSAMRSLYQQWLQDLRWHATSDRETEVTQLARQILPRMSENLAAIRQTQDEL